MQVYLGKWQETDVAVKVLLEMQHLAPSNQVQPQDPATLEPWTDSPENPTMHPPKVGDEVTVQGLRGVTDVDGSEGGQSEAEGGQEATAAIKTLEREVRSGLHTIIHAHVNCTCVNYA